MKKKIIILVVLLMLLLIGAGGIMYLMQDEWHVVGGAEGSFNKDTYLDGGIGNYELIEDKRIHYSFMIESGTLCYEITDSDGKIVKRLEVSESCDGYITFERNYGFCDVHLYALSEDTVASTKEEYEYKYNRFQKWLGRINWKHGGKFFGENYLSW